MDWKKVTHLGLLSVGVILLAYLLRYAVPAIETLELKTLDWRFHWRGPIGADKPHIDDAKVVLVTIDDFTFDMLPERWPYPRSYYANAVENLTRAGARAIGIDIIFDVADRSGPEKDRRLAEAIQESGKVVLARKLERHDRLQTLWTFVEPIPELQAAVGSNRGLVSISSDPDGIYRQYAVARKYNDEILPSFALEMLRKYYNYPDNLPINFRDAKVYFGDMTIPYFSESGMLLNYLGPRGTFPMYSFGSVIDDGRLDLGEDTLNAFNEHLLPDSVFHDKIVIIGSTVAELHDNHPTPFLDYQGAANETPGVEILANAIHTILYENYFKGIPGWVVFLVVVLMISLVLLSGLRLSIYQSLTITFILILAYCFTQFLIFNQFNWVMEMVLPAMATFFAFVAINIYEFVLTQKEKRQIMGAFQQYVPPKVVKDLMEHPEKLQLGGETRFMTVMFSDVANFTTISEALDAQQLVVLLNEYLSEMTEIVLKFDGIIDKYEGDAIMAEFGAPVYYEHHAINACLVALEMQQKLKKLARKARREGKPVLNARIGINTGNMVVGNMGSRQVFDYTVIGDEVNLASRLEGANKVYGTKLMISEATYDLIKDYMITRPLDAIRVKGKNRPVLVYELIGRKKGKMDDPRLMELLPIYQNGIDFYRSHQWEEAAECFRQCLRLRPDDGPSRVYLKRVVEFAENPPPNDWDGVHVMTSK